LIANLPRKGRWYEVFEAFVLAGKSGPAFDNFFGPGYFGVHFRRLISEKVLPMNDAPSDFWQKHSLKFLELAFRSDRRERPANPHGHGKKKGDCGDEVEFFLLLEDDRIATIAYDLHGCINTNACANAIIELVEDRTLEQAWETTPEMVAAHLSSLPPDHFHCAELATGALYLALSDAQDLRRSPWKRLYR
jgi:nitrogen fixation protein NifU and related proteins